MNTENIHRKRYMSPFSRTHEIKFLRKRANSLTGKEMNIKRNLMPTKDTTMFLTELNALPILLYLL